jgi:hypothetical protein
MIFEKVEAGRGGDLAPALEDVSADIPRYSPALLTKQVFTKRRLRLIRSPANHAFERAALVAESHGPGDDVWIPLAVPANKTVLALRHKAKDQQVECLNDEVSR